MPERQVLRDALLRPSGRGGESRVRNRQEDALQPFSVPMGASCPGPPFPRLFLQSDSSLGVFAFGGWGLRSPEG